MTVTIDLNIILDIFLERGEFDTSAEILSLCKTREIIGVIPSHALPTIYYLLRKNIGHQKALNIIDHLLTFIEVYPVGKNLVLESRKHNFSDFEDGIVSIAAKESGSTYIITNNIKDFKTSIIPAATPEKFILIIDSI